MVFFISAMNLSKSSRSPDVSLPLNLIERKDFALKTDSASVGTVWQVDVCTYLQLACLRYLNVCLNVLNSVCLFAIQSWS